MLAFDEALERVLRDAPRLESERVPLVELSGRVLAERLLADVPMPAFDYSAMDGYAVDSRAFAGDGPWLLPVVGESRTGAVPPALEPGSACRIFTGAELPRGADSIVMQEDVERDGARARFSARPRRGDHVRKAGEDLALGAVALEIGTRLGPAQIGLVAALDRGAALVARRPRVAVLATGDELRSPGSPRRPGTIPESNSFAISAMARVAGADAAIAPAARDHRQKTIAAIERALAESDLLVTIGGVSVGDHDLVRPALEAAGAELDFWKVRIKPGKPLVSGRAGKTRVLGLPGNPVSALVTFALFGVPLLRAMQGDAKPVPTYRSARLTEALRQKPGRRGYYRAILDGDRVTPLANQASGAPTSAAWANSLVVVPEESDGFDRDTEVRVLSFADL